ncbi:MAG: polyprenyl diphosphate synthase [Candidatus Paceibacterota bacterium]
MPKCIGVIMDGNRRWAKKQSLPTLEGHRRGYAKLKEFMTWAKAEKVEAVIAFALSTENWKRTKEEVGYLMDLFRFALSNEIDSLVREKTRLLFIGDKETFPEDIQKMMQNAEEDTKANLGTILAIAVSYGGREEIVEAVRKTSVRDGDEITQESFSKSLWTRDLPDPDMVIRTGGQKRLSGFLPWQTVYSELFFTDTLWPDLSKKEFGEMLREYADRQRNFGK